MSRTRGAVVAAVLVALTAVAGAGAVPAAGATGAATPVDCSFPVQATDATGTEVTVEEEPQRVVVLAPSAAQTMWDIGAKDKVVGMPVKYYTSYLNGSSEKADVVNDQGKANVEKVIGLEPDLVLAPNIVSNDTVESLRDSGVTVYKFEQAGTLEDVYAKTELTGRLVGEYENASRTSARMEGTVSAVREQVEGGERPEVYFVLGGGWTVGPGSFIHEVITAAGGENIATGNMNRSYGQLSMEVVAEEDPEYVVAPVGRPLPKSDAFNSTTAMQEGNVIRVNNNYISQPGPRNVRPLQTIAAALHPDSYDASAVENAEPAQRERCQSAVSTDTPTDTPSPEGTENGTGTPTPTATPTDGETTADATTTPASGPGVGAAGAVTAFLLVAALLARRR